MQCGDLSIDPARLTVERDGLEIELTLLEFKLLHFLAQHEGVVFSQEQLFDHVWRSAGILKSDFIRRISRLRKKI